MWYYDVRSTGTATNWLDESAHSGQDLLTGFGDLVFSLALFVLVVAWAVEGRGLLVVLAVCLTTLRLFSVRENLQPLLYYWAQWRKRKSTRT